MGIFMAERQPNSFNLDAIKKEAVTGNRYEKRISKLVSKGREVDGIKSTVENVIKNIDKGNKSFIIYGEPQSGKTEMMIALTARLLDKGFKTIIILLNDSVQLLQQNLERFQYSGIDPSPKKFSEVLDVTIDLHGTQSVLFCKKNHNDLNKFIEKLDRLKNRVVIDDEGDFATPNSKINIGERSKINSLTDKLIGDDGYYIGVTATPARLDLNNTHNNKSEDWVEFPAHSKYNGQDTFFPLDYNTNLPYKLTLLNNNDNNPEDLKEALFRFMVNVAHLNKVNPEEQNYSLLIHTSRKKEDHAEDYKTIVSIFEGLKHEGNSNHKKYYERLWEIAKERYGDAEAHEVVKYIYENKERNNVVVMNSDREKNVASNKSATTPSALFTIIIGGNIVSRGVTFENLLSMFFTRDVKSNFRQDTYIQRARMFGSRGDYLKFFELTIPAELYDTWHTCFVLHRLSLASIKAGQGAPAWVYNDKISVTTTSSIEKVTLEMHSGEMSFGLFDYNKTTVDSILNSSRSDLQKLKDIQTTLGNEAFPKYVIDYIEKNLPTQEGQDDQSKYIAIRGDFDIGRWKDVDRVNMLRPKGFISYNESDKKKYGDAIHHIQIMHNTETGKAKVFYKPQTNAKFMRNVKNYRT